MGAFLPIFPCGAEAKGREIAVQTKSHPLGEDYAKQGTSYD